MSFFVSDNLKEKISVESFQENILPTLKFFLNNTVFNVQKIKFTFGNTIVFKFKGQPSDIETIYLKNYRNCFIKIQNLKIHLEDVNIKSVNNLLDHDDAIKYIIKIKAKISEEITNV